MPDIDGYVLEVAAPLIGHHHPAIVGATPSVGQPGTTVPVCDLIMVRLGLPVAVPGSGGSGRGPGVFAAIGTRCSRAGGRRRSWEWWPGAAGGGLRGR